MHLGASTRVTRAGISGEVPVLSLDLRQPALDSRLTFSRASAATDIIGGQVVSFAANAPRISAANGLLIEEARTNSALNGSWNGINLTVTPNQSDPMGGNNASLLLCTAGSFSSTLYDVMGAAANVTAGLPYTFSHFVKAGTLSRVQMAVSTAVNVAYANFYLSGEGSVSSSGGSPLGFGIRALGNGWYRVWLVVTAGSSVQANAGIIPIATGLETRKATVTYSGSESFYTYGAQIEQGAFPTSYIPTTTAAATRAADLCSGSVSWLNMGEGTLMAEALSGGYSTASSVAQRVLCLSDAGSTSTHDLRRAVSTRSTAAITQTASVEQAAMMSDIWADGTAAKLALAWKNNDEAFCSNGTAVAVDTDTPAGMPSNLTTLWLGTGNATAGFFNGYLRNLRCWGRRLSNEQLRVITS